MQKDDIDFLNGQKPDASFSEVRICISAKSVDGSNEAVKAIKDFQPSDGWISFQSTSAKRVQGAEFDVVGENVLAGEFCNESGVSLSVRFNGDCWNFFTCMEALNGEPVLKRCVRQLSKINNKTYLNYAVYYRFEPELGFRPYFSAFTGFTEEK